jgi:hypothetical protein
VMSRSVYSVLPVTPSIRVGGALPDLLCSSHYVEQKRRSIVVD